MARPTVIQNEVILTAARAVFLERGITATSAEVAERAGVSEGSIFKRFKTKADLFRAAMGINLEDLLPAVQELKARAGTGTVEENLAEAGFRVVAFLERVMPLMMMSWSNQKVPGCPYTGGPEDPPQLRAQRCVAEYLEIEMGLGRIGMVNADVVARAFFGALTSYVFSELLALNHNKSAATIDRKEYVEKYIHILVAGMQAADTVHGRASVESAPRSQPRASLPPAAAPTTTPPTSVAANF